MKPYELGELQLRHLLVLQAIAEEGSFWAAAERLGCSQAALSQQLLSLERVLGARLIERSRGKRSIETTEAGRLLLRHAKVIVARLQAVHADFVAFSEGKAGVLRVGTFESSGTQILPAVLREFRRKWPMVEVQLTEMASDDQLLSLVENGGLDLCFAILPLPDGPFEAVQLLDDPYIVAVSAEDPPLMENAASLTLASLQSFPVVTFNDRSVEQVEAFIRSRGMELNVTFRSNYNGMVQALAAGGGVAALATLLTTDLRSSQTRVLGPVGELPPRVISLAWHRDRFRARALDSFVETASGVCAELGKSGRALLNKYKAS